MLTIYHNPRCSKSRETLKIIEDSHQEVKVVEYLKETPTREELATIVQKLGVHPIEIVRKGESLYKEKYRGKNFSAGEWLTILSENPKLIERPIVIREEKALIARPPENVRGLL